MATIVKLTQADGQQKAVWVNLDLVQTMRRQPPSPETTYSNARPESTRIWFGSNGDGSIDACDFEYVLETPEQILEAAS